MARFLPAGGGQQDAACCIGKGYAIIWEAIKGRNMPVSLFRPGEGIGNYEDFPE